MMKSTAAGASMSALIVAGAITCAIAGGPESDLRKGREAYVAREFRKAEKHFRALVEAQPDSTFGHMYLGNSLYYQEKYAEAVPEYESALELGARSGDMKQTEERVLTDQLGMSYGLSGRLPEARALFEAAIRKDPEYSMYYYNLACCHAELDNLDGALSNLKLGFERRNTVLPGEVYPDPRTDESFKRYLGNEKFRAAMKEMLPPATASSSPGGYRMRLPGKPWAVSMAIPGFTIEREEARQDKSGAMMSAANEANGLIMSIFLERETRPGTSVECRAKYFQLSLSSPF